MNKNHMYDFRAVVWKTIETNKGAHAVFLRNDDTEAPRWSFHWKDAFKFASPKSGLFHIGWRQIKDAKVDLLANWDVDIARKNESLNEEADQ